MKRMTTLAVFAAVGACISCSVALADDRAYLNDIRAQGVLYQTDQQIISFGYKTCALLRNGEPPDDVLVPG
jgi:hypothetical protein